MGALVLSTGVVVPATASADPLACRSWDTVELPVPPAVKFGGVAAAAGSYAVGNGSFFSMYGSTVLLWKDGQEVKQLSFFRSIVGATDVNSSGTVLLNSAFSKAASRWHDDGSPDGVYESLRGLAGEYEVQGLHLNERGDVLGTSKGEPVVWPAGSPTPQRVPGTDGSWTPLGLADDGSVLASSSGGKYWIGASGVISLGAAAEVTAVNGLHAVGTADAGTEDARAVRWNTSGEITATYPYFASPVAVNSRGHMLSQNYAGILVWFDPDSGFEVNHATGPNHPSLTDADDVYLTTGDETYRTPILFDCVGGGR
ncbi:hypothetical protein UK23_26115 [Lentzea aerocolonigenes]|uniref:Uncharacterized protein n=1 Tax=Lentzea aerocolonigenes TaxID=68170 RepID=A0A0F0GTY3_LENAE|nr:hypothetical protein UK23_26115 [Lentzea aerocolonigenes]